jgi:phosphoribosylglycinamide formyltransferase 1
LIKFCCWKFQLLIQIGEKNFNLQFENYSKDLSMKKITIFASGSGSNAQRIAEYFKGNTEIIVSHIYCNNPAAYVLTRAERLGIPAIIFNRNEFYKTDLVLNKLLSHKPDLIALAGFLWLIPDNILDAFERRIINIHPALLPKYGGKGMYGSRVHEAVIESGETASGITIHYVNEKYDEGNIIFQAKCRVERNETPESLASKIHSLEHEYYPRIIEKLLIPDLNS